jgi:hypothetical protein
MNNEDCDPEVWCLVSLVAVIGMFCIFVVLAGCAQQEPPAISCTYYHGATKGVCTK